MIKVVKMSNIVTSAELRETDSHGHFKASKVFREVNRLITNCSNNMCALVSWTGPDNISKVILASIQVSPTTTIIYLGSFLLGYECGSVQLLSVVTSVAICSHQITGRRISIGLSDNLLEEIVFVDYLK